ncbi:MAG: sterol desaturase family protein [Proteobacteria bacterium]|nr:sterol desaturase family protein [Pseudomonadota bacterium]
MGTSGHATWDSQLAETVLILARGVVAELAAALTSPTKRVYWLFLVGSLVLAVACYVLRLRASHDPGTRRSFTGLLRFVLRPSLWLHPSARCDYKLGLAGCVLRPLLFAPLAVSAWQLAWWLSRWLDSHLGIPDAGRWPVSAVVCLYTVVLFVAWDLSRYLLHRLLHQVPLLWQLHQVHHSAEVLTPFTFYRSHPIESWLYQVRGALVTGWVTGLFFHWFRGEAVQVELLGVNALGFCLNLAGANLRHSHVYLSYGPWLERVLISPAQHQLHHALGHRSANRNLGSWLALWDWWFGSLALASGPRPWRYGLPRALRNHAPHRLWSALFGPLVSIGRQLRACIGHQLRGAPLMDSRVSEASRDNGRSATSQRARAGGESWLPCAPRARGIHR